MFAFLENSHIIYVITLFVNDLLFELILLFEFQYINFKKVLFLS